MATQEEIFRLIQKVEGTERVEDLTAKVALAEQKLQALMAAQRASGGSSAQSNAAIQAAAGAVANYRTQLESAEKSLKRLNSAGGKGSGRALMEFSRAAEDAQYGIAGVLNNIPGLVMALGGSAGLVGAISLAAVAGAQLWKNWDGLASALGGGHVKTAAEEMEELRKKTSLTADEAERLARADNLTAKGKELRAGKTDAQQAEEKATTHAITEAGLGNVVQMVKQFAPEMLDNSPQVGALDKKIADKQAERDKLQATAHLDTTGSTYTAIGKLDDQIKGLKDSRGAVRNAAAEDIISTGALPKDWPGSRAKLAAVARKAADADPQKYIELAMSLEDADPQLAKDNALAEARAKRTRERNQEAKAEAKAEQAKLDAEAREGEAKWDADLREAQKSRTFLRKDDKDLSPAEAEAKRLFQEREGKVAAASRNKSWLTPDGQMRDDDALTPEEREAKQRAEKEDRASAKLRREQLQAPGLDAYVRDALLSGAAEGDVAAVLKGLGLDGQGVGEALLDGKKSAYESMLKGETGNSQTLQGGEALRDAIQSGVTNRDFGKEQLDRLTACEGYLKAISENRPDLTATAG